MASSTYSATPQPPQRIRIVTHPPLAPLRAWLPLPHGAATVADLLDSVAGLVRGGTALEAELQGESAADSLDSPSKTDEVSFTVMQALRSCQTRH